MSSVFFACAAAVGCGIIFRKQTKNKQKASKNNRRKCFFCEIIFLLCEKCDIMGGQSKRLIATLKVAVCFAAIVYVDL